jgi:hypothetical protein
LHHINIHKINYLQRLPISKPIYPNHTYGTPNLSASHFATALPTCDPCLGQRMLPRSKFPVQSAEMSQDELDLVQYRMHLFEFALQ